VLVCVCCVAEAGHLGPWDMAAEHSDSTWCMLPRVQCELKLSTVWFRTVLLLLSTSWSVVKWCFVVCCVCVCVCVVLLLACTLVRRPSCLISLGLRCLCRFLPECFTVTLQWIFSLCCRRFKRQHSWGNWRIKAAIGDRAPSWEERFVNARKRVLREGSTVLNCACVSEA
jgi:hypothetical protein